MKKGQITIFVILGIVVVVALGVLLSYRESLFGTRISELKGTAALGPELKEAGSIVEDCIKGVAEEGIQSLGVHGGYVDNTGMAIFEYGAIDTTYLFDGKESSLPTKEEMASGLSAYVKQNSKNCLNGLDGFEVTPAPIKDVSTEIYKENVEISVEWPISLKKGTSESKLDGFVIDLPVRLGTLYSEISGFMAVQAEKPDEICLSCLIDSSERNEFSVEVNNFITTYVFVIKDKKSSLDSKEPYRFIFANGY